MGFVVIQKENLAAIKIKGYLVAVKANLGSNLTKMVIGVIIFIISAIEIIKELIMFIRYKAFKLKIFGVVITGKVRKSVKVIR